MVTAAIEQTSVEFVPAGMRTQALFCIGAAADLPGMLPWRPNTGAGFGINRWSLNIGERAIADGVMLKDSWLAAGRVPLPGADRAAVAGSVVRTANVTMRQAACRQAPAQQLRAPCAWQAQYSVQANRPSWPKGTDDRHNATAVAATTGRIYVP
jgi:hypothetical protein